MKHALNVGNKVKLINNIFLDHLPLNIEGVITELTVDDEVPSYNVTWVNGETEKYVHPLEIEFIPVILGE